MSKKEKKKGTSVETKERIPNYVKDLLKPYFRDVDMDDPEKGILICTETDMNDKLEFTLGHLVLCRDRIFVLVSEAVPGEVHFFKGRETLASKAQTVKREWTVKEYSLTDMKEMKIERTVGGGFLMLVHKNPDDEEADGKAEVIASFSNHRIGQTTRVERLCEKIVENEKIEEDDDEKEEKAGLMTYWGII